MNETFEELWSLKKNDIEIHVHKETAYINATNLGKSINRKFSAWISKHKKLCNSIKEKLNTNDDIVKQINIHNMLTIIHHNDL